MVSLPKLKALSRVRVIRCKSEKSLQKTEERLIKMRKKVAVISEKDYRAMESYFTSRIDKRTGKDDERKVEHRALQAHFTSDEGERTGKGNVRNAQHTEDKPVKKLASLSKIDVILLLDENK